MFRSWITRAFGKTMKPSRRQRRAAGPATRSACRPHLEKLEERTLLSTTLPITIASSGTEMGDTHSPAPTTGSVSANGQYEVFISSASDLINGVTIQSGDHVYLCNLSTGTTSLVDVNLSGAAPDAKSDNYAALSPDGRYVAFFSYANDLTNNDANVSAIQLYVRDMQAGQTYLVSLGSDGNPETNGGPSDSPPLSIAEDGQGHLFLAYQSNATNLAAGNSSKREQIYLATLNLDSGGNIQYQSLQTVLVSQDASGTDNGSNADSSNPVLSKDGSTLMFTSKATNLNVPGGYNDNLPDVADLYLYSLSGKTLKLLSVEPTTSTNATGNSYSTIVSSIGLAPNLNAGTPQSINANGQYVVFSSLADNLVSGLPTYDSSNVYRRDLVNGTTSLVSINVAGTASPDDPSSNPVITPNGRYVAFQSNDAAGDLTSNDPGGKDVFVRDMQQGKTYLVSLTTNGKSPNSSEVRRPTIAETSNGQLVIAYDSDASNLTSGDTNTTNFQIIVTTFNLDSKGDIEYNTLTTKLVSADSSGNGANGDSTDALLSKNGSTVAFFSSASNLKGEIGDAAGSGPQLFAYNIASAKLTQVSPAPGFYNVVNGQLTQGGSPNDHDAIKVYAPIGISDNGQYIAYNYKFDNGNTGGGSSDMILGWNANTGTNIVIDPGLTGYNVIVHGAQISGDGSTITFTAGDVFGHGVIYAASNWQSGSPSTTQISPDVGAKINGDSVFSVGTPSISEDGKVIAYRLDYTFNASQVFVYDNGTTSEASKATGGGDGNATSDTPAVSADGSTIAFNSSASDLVAGVLSFTPDPTNRDNVFAYKVPIQTVSLVSAKAPGVFTTDSDILFARISDNGRYVAYDTGANDLLGNLPFAPNSVFAEDVQQSIPTVIASNSFAHIYSVVLSGDGSTVAFDDNAQLTSTTTNGQQIYSATSWQKSTPGITLVSVGIDHNPNNGGANQAVENPSISGNGQVIAFDSTATNLTNNDPNGNGHWQVLVRNLGTNTTNLVSSNSAGTDGGNDNSTKPIVSADGGTVIYSSSATDLVSGVSVPTDSADNPIVPQVYAYLSNTSAPVVLSSPSNQTVTAGQTVTFTASASGSPVPIVQWQVSTDGGKTFSNLSGATSTTLTLNNVTASMNGNQYEAVFTNNVGSATTHAATLTVNSPAPPPPAPPPPAPPSPPPPKTPPLLALFDSLLAGTLTVNSDGTETITDSLFGIPLLVSTFDSSGNLKSVSLFGINITFLFG